MYALLFNPYILLAQNDEDILKRKKYILKLFDEQKYPEFASETEKFLYFNPMDEERAKFLYLKSYAYFEMGRFDTALLDIKLFSSNFMEDNNYPKSLLLKEKIYFKKREFESVVNTTEELFEIKGYDELKAEALWYKVLSLIESGDYEQAKVDVKILNVNYLGGSYKSEATRLDEHLADCCDFDARDERIALALSIIPGAGHIYLGKYYTGIAFFLSSTIFTSASIFSLKEGNIPEFFIWAPLGLLFYTSNFYDAYREALHYEENNKIEFLNSAREFYPKEIRP